MVIWFLGKELQVGGFFPLTSTDKCCCRRRKKTKKMCQTVQKEKLCSVVKWANLQNGVKVSKLHPKLNKKAAGQS